MPFAQNFHPEWGYLAPAPSFVQTVRIVLVATAIGATAGAGTVLALMDRPGAETRIATQPASAMNAPAPASGPVLAARGVQNDVQAHPQDSGTAATPIAAAPGAEASAAAAALDELNSAPAPAANTAALTTAETRSANKMDALSATSAATPQTSEALPSRAELATPARVRAIATREGASEKPAAKKRQKLVRHKRRVPDYYASRERWSAPDYTPDYTTAYRQW